MKKYFILRLRSLVLFAFSFFVFIFFCEMAVAKEAWSRKEKATIGRSNISVRSARLDDVKAQCVTCHAKETPGIYEDWRQSQHAKAKISCLDCHQAEPTDPDAIKCSGIDKENLFVKAVVSPENCSKCHLKEAKEFEESDHSGSWKSLKAFKVFRGNFISEHGEKVVSTVGCQQCHGSEIKLGEDKRPTPETWPNEGIGRLNPDGSKGTCAACHTRHKFSLAEARKPESCGSCHLGPDHPQLEIYMESKHGVRYETEGGQWKWESASGTWRPGDYAAPTCATCHMSAIGPLDSTHNISERLSWELEKPLSRKTKNWEAKRKRMKEVCLQCHGPNWVDNFYVQFDEAVELYNEEYYKPAKAMVDDLYEKGILTKEDKFDEPIEIALYELWHHEGRRARMGASMMAQDWAWWEGFYEVSKTYQEIERMYKELITEVAKEEKE